ncbi:MAG: winged helix DNA-binding domain-containing protein [Actinomycetota bacterium]
MSVTRALERLVGLQAQEPPDPYVALWSRLDGFAHDDLAKLIASRRAVRVTLMRGTIHLVTARDCLRIWPVMQPFLERFFSGHPWGRNLAGVDLKAVLDMGKALVEAEPMTNVELGPKLSERWPDRDRAALAAAVRYLLPMVQVPPRGLWGKSGRAKHTTATQWLRRPLGVDKSPDRLVLRYLSAFGPSTVGDIRKWSGLSGLPEVVERLPPRLRSFRDENGRELLDVKDGLIPEDDTPAPPRFLPTFDNVLLAHDDRSRIISPADRRRLTDASLAGGFGTVLIDGFVGATWKLNSAGKPALLEIKPLRRLSKSESSAVEAEGRLLLEFLRDDRERSEVRIAKPLD